MASCRSDIAARIKEAVTCADLLERNGYHPDRHGLMLCPFHSEKTPSFRVYPNGKGWYCFGCHKGGDVLNLAVELYGVGFSDACKRLSDDFNLGLTRDDRTPKERRESALDIYRRKYQRQQAKREHEGHVREWAKVNAQIQQMEAEGGDPYEIAALSERRSYLTYRLEEYERGGGV